MDWRRSAFGLDLSRGRLGQGSKEMLLNKISMPLLLILGFISVALFLLGISFSGGVLNIFARPPANDDIVSITFWLIKLAIILATFPLLTFRFIQFLMR